MTHSHHHTRNRSAGGTPGLDDDVTEALLRTRRFLQPGRRLRRPADAAPDRRPRRRHLLPRPLEPRQGRPLHARRQLHRLLLVEGLRQGRDHHLGVPADRLPVGRARTGPSTSPAAARAAPRSPGTPTRPRGCATRTSAASLLQMYREAKARLGDPVLGVGRRSSATPSRRASTRPARARAGWCAPPGTRPPRWSRPRTCTRSSSTARTGSPGFSPIPAMSMVCHAAGARFVSLIGGAMLSFYDWYADLPVASPQVFGDQTDVPGVRRLVGRRLPDPVGLERPGHPHPGRALDDRGALPRPEGRRVSPGLRRQHEVRRRVARARIPAPTARWRWRWGTSCSRSSSSTGRRPTSPTTSSATPTCRSWSRSARRGEAFVPGKFLTAADLGDDGGGRRSSRPCCSTTRPASRSCRTARSATGSPRPARAAGTSTWAASTRCSRCSHGSTARRPSTPQPSTCRASTPPTAQAACCAAGCRSDEIGGRLVTTVFDLLLAQYGVGRAGLPGNWPTGYDDATEPGTPAWQEQITGVPAADGANGSGASSRRTPRSPAAAR